MLKEFREFILRGNLVDDVFTPRIAATGAERRKPGPLRRLHQCPTHLPDRGDGALSS
jgi:hypothetical protein